MIKIKADQESLEGDEDKDSLAEDDSIKHDESGYFF